MTTITETATIGTDELAEFVTVANVTDDDAPASVDATVELTAGSKQLVRADT